LLIHGLGSSADRWLDIHLALSLHYHTIAVDLPGFGMSDRPATGFGFGIEEYSDFIAKFIQRLGFGEQKTTLVGHSLGGYIASEVAIRIGSLASLYSLIHPEC
jgi:Predicted hydrolases or acyltransferases (alpha/beta hydrolase superfamily)